MPLRILVCGASGGLGHVVAEHLQAQGAIVEGTMRTPDAARFTFPMRALDVTDDASVSACIDGFVAEHGGIDVIVNCFNRMILGSVEETAMDEVTNLYAVDVLGLIRVCRTVLPHMRAQGNGTIINLSSLGGLLPVPYLSAYTSAKFAIEAFSEALYHEAKPHGVSVVIMQPVAMRMDRPDTGAHLELARGVTADSFTHQMVARMAKDTRESALTPEQVAAAISAVIDAPRKPLRKPLDRARVLTLVRRLAPQWVIDKLIGSLLPPAPKVAEVVKVPEAAQEASGHG
jgi:short-subunit dehydrogenase